MKMAAEFESELLEDEETPNVNVFHYALVIHPGCGV
jgi:hypothetical protein